MSWASERRFGYAVGTALVLLLLAGGAFFALYYDPATCSDSKQNGEELGVDCGGVCEMLCPFEAAPLKVLWSRIFEVSPGRYNAVAYVENPNRHAGVREIGYIFRVVDGNNDIIIERKGRTFITPDGISPIFEADVRTGEKIPSRVFFEFTEDPPQWYRAQSVGQALSVNNTRLLDTATRPRIDALLQNNSLQEYKDLEVVGVVFAADGNAVAASRTVIDVLEKSASFPLVFTWPRPFERRLEQCVVPADIVLAIDTSGSMNDIGGTPPQPITDAKLAAASFVGRAEEDDRIGVVSFGTLGRVLQELTLSHSDARAVVEGINISPQEETGRTNIAEGLKQSREALLARARESKYARVIVLLTDGKANAPTEVEAEPLAERESAAAKLSEISIYTIGLGGSVNQEFLKKIASSPAHYFQAATSRDLESIYREINTAICERGPAVIDITPRVRESLYVR